MANLNQLTLFWQGENISFQKRIENIYDHLYANSSVRTPSGICTEVGKIIHVGMYKEEVLKDIPAFEFQQAEIKNLFKGVGHYRAKLTAEVKKDFNKMNRLWKLYGKGNGIKLNEFDLCYVCSQLSGIEISNKKKDLFGDAIEIFRTEWAKRAGGQFFTDQRVTELAMKLLEFDPRKGDDLVDICAGTGGFLIAGMNQIRELLEREKSKEPMEAELVRLATESLRGQEVDKDVCEVANATLLARLGNGEKKIVFLGDSLKLDAFNDTKSRINFGEHSCAASNPPFGTKITVKDPDILQQYELAKRVEKYKGRAKKASIIPRAPDILFLERNVQMLKPGKGKLAIVLPYQLLSGPKAFFVREWLLRNTKLLAVVDLPPETFQPHTGTKTSLILIERRKKPLEKLKDEDGYDIFMSMPRWIGHDRRGYPLYKRTPDGKLTTEILTDVGQVKEALKLFRHGKSPKTAHDRSFRVKYSSIINDSLLRINALFHEPNLESLTTMKTKQASEEWQIVKLGELIKNIFYPGRFKRNYIEPHEEAIPFLGGSNITEFLVRKEKWLSPNDPKLESLRVYEGWILVTRSGTTGIVASVPKAWDGYAMSEHIIRIIPDPQKIDPTYLLGFLRSKYAQEQLARGVFGSVIDEINPEYIGQLEVLIPSKQKEFKKITSMIKAGEEARQEGITKYSKAINYLDCLLMK